MLGRVCGELLIFDTNQQFATHRFGLPGDHGLIDFGGALNDFPISRVTRSDQSFCGIGWYLRDLDI